MTSDFAIEATGVLKEYGATQALRGVSLTVRRADVVGVLGPNGAGKTTLVEILEGFRARSGGDARVLGVDPAQAGAGWRARIGIVLQSSGGFDELTVGEVLEHVAAFYPSPMAAGRVVGLVGLEEKRRTRCKHLSGGQRRRLDVALGIIGDPELIFLDEPTTGFDPSARRQAWGLVRELSSLGKTVLLTTHYLDEAEALADRVVVIVAGRVVADATPATLGGPELHGARVSFSLEGALVGATLPREAVGADVHERRVVVRTDSPTATVAALAAWARALGVDELPELAVTRPSLEDVYLAMIDEGAAPSETVVA